MDLCWEHRIFTIIEGVFDPQAQVKKNKNHVSIHHKVVYDTDQQIRSIYQTRLRLSTTPPRTSMFRHIRLNPILSAYTSYPSLPTPRVAALCQEIMIYLPPSSRCVAHDLKRHVSVLLGIACKTLYRSTVVNPILFRVVCVCVFSSHSFWTSSSLDVPAGVTQEEGHTGFFIHLPSAVRALIFLARRIQPHSFPSSTVNSNFVY